MTKKTAFIATQELPRKMANPRVFSYTNARHAANNFSAGRE
jgi:hypothetical protein